MPAKRKASAQKNHRLAEVAAEHWCHRSLGCVETRRAIRTRFFKVDFFGADVMGLKADGTKVFVQVTTGDSSCLSARRRKLESRSWHPTDLVCLLQMRASPDPANRRRTQFHFVAQALVREWGTDETGALSLKSTWDWDDSAFLIPPEWFRPHRETDIGKAPKAPTGSPGIPQGVD